MEIQVEKFVDTNPRENLVFHGAGKAAIFIQISPLLIAGNY